MPDVFRIQLDFEQLVGRITALEVAAERRRPAMIRANEKIAELIAKAALERLKSVEVKGTNRSQARTGKLEDAIMAPENRTADEYGFYVGLESFLDGAVVGHGRNSNYWRVIEGETDIQDYSAKAGFTNRMDRGPDAPGVAGDPESRYWKPRAADYGQQLFMPQLDKSASAFRHGARKKYSSPASFGYNTTPRWVTIHIAKEGLYKPLDVAVLREAGLLPTEAQIMAIYKENLPKEIADLIST